MDMSKLMSLKGFIGVKIFEELKKENKILELGYILPDGYNRIESIFFPTWTSFKLTNQGEINVE